MGQYPGATNIATGNTGTTSAATGYGTLIPGYTPIVEWISAAYVATVPAAGAGIPAIGLITVNLLGGATAQFAFPVGITQNTATAANSKTGGITITGLNLPLKNDQANNISASMGSTATDINNSYTLTVGYRFMPSNAPF